MSFQNLRMFLELMVVFEILLLFHNFRSLVGLAQLTLYAYTPLNVVDSEIACVPVLFINLLYKHNAGVWKASSHSLSNLSCYRDQAWTGIH